MDQKSKAEVLKRLHGGPHILVLANAWDAASARIVEAESFPAIATSSSACAAVFGYKDGQAIPREEMLFLIRKIVSAVEVPVTADIEAGYGDPVRTALDAIEAGVVGMNFEDMVDGELVPLDVQIGHIRAIRAAADSTGVPLVLNARTDIYLASHGHAGTRFERTLERTKAFFEAGADCVFVPGVRDAETIELLARAIDGPLNILAQPGSPSVVEMRALGVARVSFGGGASRVAMGAFRGFVKELRAYGTFGALE